MSSMPAGIDVGLAVAALYAGAIAAVVAFQSLRRLWQSACSSHSPCALAKPRSRSCPLPCEYPRPPGVLCRDRASHAKIRNLDPWSARSGNKRLKNALLYSTWVSSHSDPNSKAYYDRKRAEGKHHNTAVICLARRRCNVIFAMLQHSTYYQPATTTPTPEPATLAA